MPCANADCFNKDGHKLNVNADMAAGAVAKALKAEKCLFVTDVKGVLKDRQLIEELSEEETNLSFKKVLCMVA